MAKKSLTKYIIIGLSLLIVGSIIYFIFISYITSNGFRNYQEFCANYILMIEQYKNKHKEYPSELSTFQKPEYYPRYDAERCGYFVTEEGYTLVAPAGLIGAYIYSSETKKWRYD